MLLQKAIRMLTTSGMPMAWSQWIMPRVLSVPSLTLKTGGRIQGFQNFSEFWGARTLVPSSREIHFIERYAALSGALIDIGANLGYVSLTLAKLRPDSLVHAFEPSPQTHRRLLANIALNNVFNVDVHQLAVGRESGIFRFREDSRSPTTNRLETSTTSNVRLDTIDVNVTTLDDFLFYRHVSDVAFLKIDVEGHEVHVLEGAQQMLKERRCAAGLIELCPANLHYCGSSVKELISRTVDLGYQLHFILDDGQLGEAVTVENAAAIILDNVALVPATK